MQRNPVTIASGGGGPAGTLLSQILDTQGVESVVLEQRSREYVLSRIRAGVLEQGSAETLREVGAGGRMDRESEVHHGVGLAFAGRRFRVDFKALTDQTVTVYGQTQIQRDLYDARDLLGGQIVDEAEDVTLRHGRLFLAGDAAHIVPPTGAKGLNLAISDVVYLSRALVEHYRTGSNDLIDAYSDMALGRVWKAVRFSWWMTNLMHPFPEAGSFGLRTQEAELDYLSASQAAQTALAENYTGLPFH